MRRVFVFLAPYFETSSCESDLSLYAQCLAYTHRFQFSLHIFSSDRIRKMPSKENPPPLSVVVFSVASSANASVAAATITRVIPTTKLSPISQQQPLGSSPPVTKATPPAPRTTSAISSRPQSLALPIQITPATPTRDCGSWKHLRRPPRPTTNASRRVGAA